jgi:hypothetical protein
MVWIKQFGHVKLFRMWLKDKPRHYTVFLPDEGQLAAVNQKTFIEQHDVTSIDILSNTIGLSSRPATTSSFFRFVAKLPS